MRKRIQPHIMCGVGDIAKYVLLPGDPNRVEKIASFFDEARKVADYRGFKTYTGEVDGVGVSVCSTGIGCPTAAIVIEELTNIGADTLIRVGTTGSLQPSINVGEIIVATAAVRGDGTSRSYVPIEYPAVASIEVVNSLLKAARKMNRRVHKGIVWSTDSFYGGNKETVGLYGKANVLSVEMEASILFSLSGLRGFRSGAILAVDGNLVKGEMKGEFEPDEMKGERDERVLRAIEDEIKIALKAVKQMERDYSFT